MEVIILGDLNVRLRELQDARGDELAAALADSGLGDVIAHFITRWQYRGKVNWTWQMRQEGRQVTGRGDYILRSDRNSFVNLGVREARLHTDHQIILPVL